MNAKEQAGRIVADDGLPTRERILAAAGRLFASRGYDGTSVSSIAKAVGISTPALYWHFDSKDAIYEAFLDIAYNRLIDAIIQHSGGDTPRERLRAFVRAFVASQLQERELAGTYDVLYGYNQLVVDAPDPVRLRLGEAQRRFMEFLCDIIRDGMKSGDFHCPDATVTAFAIATSCEYVFQWVRPGGRLTDEEIAEMYGEIMIAAAVCGPT